MLPSKIEDFQIFGGSKRPSKSHPFLYRIFIDFGSVLASNMGPSWEPRRLKIRKKIGMELQKIFMELLFFGSEYEPAFEDRSRASWPRFWGGSGLDFRWFLDDFSELLGLLWACFRLLFLALVLGVLGDVFSQLCQENPRTCRGQSRESKNLPRTKPRRKSVRTPSGKLKSPSFLLANSLPYRKGPDSENFGRRYSPQGGFNNCSKTIVGKAVGERWWERETSWREFFFENCKVGWWRSLDVWVACPSNLWFWHIFSICLLWLCWPMVCLPHWGPNVQIAKKLP